jgi:hypothetical protein
MQRHIAHYTLVRLLPQADAGEFANMGVVLACPAKGFLAFRLITRYGRITRFFEEFAGELFTRVRKEVQAELQHIQQHVLHHQAGPYDESLVLRVMQDLTKPRESLIRYAPLRVAMTDDPQALLDQLFVRYVQRDANAMRHRREEVLNRLVRRVLDAHQLGKAFVPDEIGTEDFHVRLPLVHECDGQILGAIKPLDLAQDEPQQIYDHGGWWAERLRRLRRMSVLPEHTLIAVDAPPEADARRFRAYQDIASELRELQVGVMSATDTSGILTFARGLVS